MHKQTGACHLSLEKDYCDRPFIWSLVASKKSFIDAAIIAIDTSIFSFFSFMSTDSRAPTNPPTNAPAAKSSA